MTTKEHPTLFDLGGRRYVAPRLADSVILFIDLQNEYLAGPLAIPGAGDAVERANRLLYAARREGAVVIHVAHAGQPGGPFDRNSYRGEIIAAVRPEDGEAVVEKTSANAFARTDLDSLIGDRSLPLIIAGFMTHNCVSSTARAAAERGFTVVIAADATGTRALPSPWGVVSAHDLHNAELAALSDAQAWVRPADTIIAEGA